MLTLNVSRQSADTEHVTTSSAFLVPWAMVWVVLFRALLVRADVLPKTCTKCSRPLVRSEPGEDICGCD